MPQLFLVHLHSPRETIRQFPPAWFQVVMGTGVLSTLLANFPYQFNGLQNIGWALWWLSLVLLLVFSAMLLSRFVLFSEDTAPLLSDPVQSMFLGTIPMAMSSVINGLVIFCVPAWGQGVASAAYVLVFINAGLVMTCGWLVPFKAFTVHKHSLEGTSALWLLPIVPAVVHANTCAILATYTTNQESARVMVYTSFTLLGFGLPLALSCLVLFYQRLALYKLPPREAIISSFLPLGPLGSASAAFLQLGMACEKGIFQEMPLMGGTFAAQAQGFGLIAGLLLWGYGAWWLVVACASVLTTSMGDGTPPFNMGWWGFIFPWGVLTVATLDLARVTGNSAFSGIGAAFVVILVCLWLMVMGRTVLGAWTGHLLNPPCLSQSGIKAMKKLQVSSSTAQQLSSSAGQLLNRPEDEGAAVVVEVGAPNPGNPEVSAATAVKEALGAH